MIDEKTKIKIESELSAIEKENKISIIYACESGSRGWGFPSPDSDYDVRFIYIHSKEWYLSIDKKRDTLGFPINSDLDIDGWDIRKVLLHIQKSNSVMYEWLQSPIVYKSEHESQKRLMKLSSEYFTPGISLNHYLGICKKYYSQISDTNETKTKRLFYILRPLLSAIWIIKNNKIPPMEFNKLLELVEEKNIHNKIIEIIKAKSKLNESHIITIDNDLKDYIDCKYSKCLEFNIDNKKDNKTSAPLDEYFIKLLDMAGMNNEH